MYQHLTRVEHRRSPAGAAARAHAEPLPDEVADRLHDADAHPYVLHMFQSIRPSSGVGFGTRLHYGYARPMARNRQLSDHPGTELREAAQQLEQLSRRIADLAARSPARVGPLTDAQGIARLAAALQRARRESLGADIVRDPSWDILLDIFVARGPGPTMEQRQLNAHGHVPQATLLAHLDRLEAKGLIVRRGSNVDGRLVVIELTDDGERRMRGYLAEAGALVQAAKLSGQQPLQEP